MAALTHHTASTPKQKSHLQLPRSGALFTGRGRCKWLSSIVHYDNAFIIRSDDLGLSIPYEKKVVGGRLGAWLSAPFPRMMLVRTRKAATFTTNTHGDCVGLQANPSLVTGSTVPMRVDINNVNMKKSPKGLARGINPTKESGNCLPEFILHQSP